LGLKGSQVKALEKIMQGMYDLFWQKMPVKLKLIINRTHSGDLLALDAKSILMITRSESSRYLAMKDPARK